MIRAIYDLIFRINYHKNYKFYKIAEWVKKSRKVPKEQPLNLYQELNLLENYKLV